MSVSAIGQGTGGDDVCDDALRIRVIQAGVAFGMTFIDTAEVYQNGHSEEVVGKAVKHMRKDVFIASKFSPEHASYDGIMNAVKGSLKRLSTDTIDLYQVHWPNPTVPISETMRALSELQENGHIRHIGVSNFSLDNFKEAQKTTAEKIVSNQVEYNLFERGIETDLLPYAVQNDVMILAYRPLLYSTAKKAVLDRLAQKYGKTVHQIILNWLISHNSVVPIPKTLNIEHARQNAQAADFHLDAADKINLDEAFARKIVYLETNKISVLPSEQEKVYVTLKEALENRFGLKPSPQELAKDILENNILKPVHVRPVLAKNPKVDYELIQGRIRYWAWIIAYGPNKPLPACIME